MKRKLFLFFFGIFSLAIYGQTKNGNVSGIVKSSEGNPLEGATVLLLKAKDSSISRTAITDKQGQFNIRKVAYGKYILSITSIGYNDFKSPAFSLDSVTHDRIIQNVTLTLQAKNLGSVTVTAQRPFLERRIDKLVVNVASSPVNAGQSALDVLEKSPGVIVDENDNISLNGKQGATIFIDGKMSYLAGKDLTNYLRGLPAAQLDQIELITRPSAKHDAAGISGIINIKIKKNQADGFSGSVTTSGIFGYYFKNRDNITLNLRKNKFNSALTYGFAYTKNFVRQHTVRNFRSDYNSNFNLYQDQHLSFLNFNLPHNFRIATDYAASKNTTVGVVVSGFFSNNKPASGGEMNFFDSLHRQTGYNISSTRPDNSISNLGFNLNLLHKPGKKGKEITADADYVFYNNLNKQTTENDFYGNNNVLTDPFILRNYIPSELDIYSFKSDYTQPLNKDGKLEAGIKISYVKTDNNGGYSQFDSQRSQWVTDTSRSNHFVYAENINAAYININKQFNKKWSLQAGLRLEQTVAKGNQMTKAIQFDKNYTRLFPSIFLTYAVDDKNTFSMNYGKGISRPNYQDLNPFQYFIDELNIRQGNPALQPMFTHDLQMVYNYKNQFDISVDYARINNVFALIYSTQVINNKNVIIQTRQNTKFRQMFAVTLDYSKAIKKWWNFTGSVFVFHNQFSSYPTGNLAASSANICFISVSNQFPLKKGWTLDASGFYRSKRLEGGYIHALATYSFSIGAAKKMIKNKASLTMNLNDPFWLMKTDSYTEQSSFFNKTYNHPENRWLTVTFNYRFGKSSNQRRRNTGSSQDEQNRVNF